MSFRVKILDMSLSPYITAFLYFATPTLYKYLHPFSTRPPMGRWGHMRHSYKITYFTQRQHASAMQPAVCAVTIHQKIICNMSSSHFHWVRKVITCHMSHVCCVSQQNRAKVGPSYHMLAENKYSLHTSSGGNPAHPLSSSCNWYLNFSLMASLISLGTNCINIAQTCEMWTTFLFTSNPLVSCC